MDAREHALYWRPVRERLEHKFPGDNNPIEQANKRPKHKASQYLASMLGMPYPQMAYWNRMELTDQLKETLIALNNPHVETLLKVIQVRRETVDDKG